LFAAPSATGAQIGYRTGYRQGNALYDDLRISNRARTDAEIQTLYQNNQSAPVSADTILKADFDGNLDAQSGIIQ